jgi:hypothetical protein
MFFLTLPVKARVKVGHKFRLSLILNAFSPGQATTRTHKSSNCFNQRIERNGRTGTYPIPAKVFFVRVSTTSPAKNMPLTPVNLSNGSQPGTNNLITFTLSPS